MDYAALPVGATILYPGAEIIARQFYETIGDEIIVMRKAQGRRLEVWHVGGGSPDNEFMLVCADMHNPENDVMHFEGSLTQCMLHLDDLTRICEAASSEEVRASALDAHMASDEWAGVPPDLAA